MANQLNRMVYRQDQVLQLPFPEPPSLARQIENGVLKKDGAVKYDELQKRDREAIQNILKLSLRWPKLEDWQRQLQEVQDAIADITSNQTSISTLQTSVASLTLSVASLSLSISNILADVASLTNAINADSIPLIVFTNTGENPIFPAVVGKMGIFGSQRATNTYDGAWWTWNGVGWSAG